MKVLIIEDEPEIAEAVSLCFQLRWGGAQVSCASRGRKGIDMAETECPDIVILDVGLPDLDGIEVCRKIRLFSDVPIVMLTARGREIDKIEGLDAGADDYVTKPFSHTELIARVKAVLRRSDVGGLDQTKQALHLGTVCIDFAANRVRVKGREVPLTPTEHNLLFFLARNVGQIVSNQVLVETVWGKDYADGNDYLTAYVGRLRVKLGDSPDNPRLIVSEPGIGYRLAKPPGSTDGLPNLQTIRHQLSA
ncbi:MAG: response regulator transcription factor [Dehalococcoidia bacterium]|nr:response regulator transcription factor [Dehalococcoidia bacterium]